MKKFIKMSFFVLASLVFAKTYAQPYIHGTIYKGTNANAVDIFFKANYNSAVGEYANGTTLTVAVLTTPGLVANITLVGNYSGLSADYTTEVMGAYTLFEWQINQIDPVVMSWTSGIEFKVATVTFTNTAPSFSNGLVQLVDRENSPNINAYFGVATNKLPNDKTDYAARFYSDGVNNSITTEPNGDQTITASVPVPLPITLVSFNALKSGTGVNLNWIVSLESNAKEYTIERSANGVNFNSVNTVSANGNSSYNTVDAQPISGINYYRLKMVDNDGKFKYSAVRTVLIDGKSVIFDVYPNPVVSSKIVLHIQQYNYDGKAQAIVTDIAGRRIQTTPINIVKGNNELPITVNNLSRGTYFIGIFNANGELITANKKIVKQ